MFAARALVLAALLAGGALAASAADTDRDGYPDALELVGLDRAAFADWFAAVAESQYYGLAPDWKAADQDCAGLLRYAFVNALAKHDAAWWAKFRFLPRPRLPEVRGFSYPAPLVSRSVFRVAPGPYRAGDVDAGKLVGRTSARFLANFSAAFVTRDPARAQRGDLLFFLRPTLGAYHSMVYLGGGRAVYHTGAGPGEGGEVRLVTLATLMRHPDPAFHPTPGNPNFLGVYRWQILR
ncbi:hypothetical protein DEIPH_ctg045orf0015 [Deinococcus phoenicis]|uniref:DUF1175 domain-containing protein n=1 Tax=Deinococcus phoenicis TaxID=1476583 RepID=A0A016QMB0_9DEIO|nr:DUF1175 family protein [Deinococcus phoenicis]EYB67285.1 hypothetical protein DEIPH_ctg045orf0015 [Deinococcus phoenicis]